MEMKSKWWLKRFCRIVICGVGCDLLRTVIGLFIVCGGCLIVIRCCTFFAINENHCVALNEYVPLLESLVWPVFLLIVIFYFSRNFKSVLKEIPGLFRRSYLPNSPLPPMKMRVGGMSLIESESEDYGIVSNEGKTDLHRDTQHNTSSGKAEAVLKNHKGNVKKVLALLQVEYGVEVFSEVAVENSSWRSDGAFDFNGQRYYVAVLPFELKNRVPMILSRMQATVLGENKIFMLFVYGCDDAEDFIDSMNVLRTKILLRAKKFSEKDLKEGEKL